jgi:hypothetical protein
MVYDIVNFRLFCNGDDWGMVYGSVLIIYYFASGYLTQRTGESQVNHQKTSMNGPFSMTLLNNQRVNI